MTIDDIIKKVALRLKLNKLEGCGIAAPILVHEYLKRYHSIETTLVQGQYISEHEKCAHVWLRYCDKDYDIGHVMACLVDPEFTKVQYSLVEGPSELSEQFDLYQEKPSVFWKNYIRPLQNFRSKLLYNGSRLL
jgi:hypothetical protein